jgi:hypothetical protein
MISIIFSYRKLLQGQVSDVKIMDAFMNRTKRPSCHENQFWNLTNVLSVLRLYGHGTEFELK